MKGSSDDDDPDGDDLDKDDPFAKHRSIESDDSEWERQEIAEQYLRLVAWPQKVELVRENMALDYLTINLIDPNCPCSSDEIFQMAASTLATFSIS